MLVHIFAEFSHDEMSFEMVLFHCQPMSLGRPLPPMIKKAEVWMGCGNFTTKDMGITHWHISISISPKSDEA